MLPVVCTVDFETPPIEDRPDFPPDPVGVAIREPDGKAYYARWGHPSGNNCTKVQAVEHLRSIWLRACMGQFVLLFHNSKFDVAVACEKLGLPMPAWRVMHDTQFLLFLADPHSKTLELKPAAESWLGWKPEEKDAVGDWVWDHRAELREKYPDLKISRSRGADGVQRVVKVWQFFWIVPGDILAPYAVGDVQRTFALFAHLYPLIVENGMLVSYDRERELMPILLENERVGMRVDLEGLTRDVPVYQSAFEYVEQWLRWRLSAPTLNFNEDIEVAEALERSGVVAPDSWTLTESGQKSVSKANLKPKHFTDPQVASALGYRNRLETCLKMFMLPWLRQGAARGGWISTNWNQTRGQDGGTRTGRPSTREPNFLNISKDFDTKKDDYVHPEFLGVPRLPLVRKYILPDPGHVFCHRDFSGQELRVFAHFECGELNAAYNAKPELDPHDEWVRPIMEKAAGREYDRTTIKVLNFQGIYGGGAPALAKALDITIADAKAVKAVHDKALPGRVILDEEIKRQFGREQPIRTWGGRLYYCEPPGFSKKYKRFMTYEYKGINYEVQGSAADLTKQAILDWYNDPERDPRVRFLITVYDEINISCPVEIWEQQMQVLRRAMEKRRLSVPMLSDGKVGESWGTLKKCA